MTSSSTARSGFTIVELLVSMALFSILVTIGVGGVVSALRTQRQVAALLAANSNLSLTMEQIARELRTGYDFCQPPNNCPTTQTIAFTNADGKAVRYCWTAPGGSTPGFLSRRANATNPAPNCNNTDQITANNVTITNAVFTPRGLGVNDGVPRVTILLVGSPNDPTLTGANINLETMVSARFNYSNP